MSTGKPTYLSSDRGKAPDLIDFFEMRGISLNYSFIEENHNLTFDHSSIVLTVSETVIAKQPPLTMTNRLTDWEGFREELEQNIKLEVPLKTTEQLDTESEQFILDLQRAAWHNTPMLNPKTRLLSYLKEIRDMVTSKRKARKRWQQTRSPADKRLPNKLCEQLKQTIYEIKNEGLTNFLSNLSGDKKSDYSL